MTDYEYPHSGHSDPDTPRPFALTLEIFRHILGFPSGAGSTSASCPPSAPTRAYSSGLVWIESSTKLYLARSGSSADRRGRGRGMEGRHQGLALQPLTDGFVTRAIHVPNDPNAETGAVIQPISLSTTLQEPDGTHKGCECSHSSIPIDPLERKPASLKFTSSQSIVGLAFSSGSTTTSACLPPLRSSVPTLTSARTTLTVGLQSTFPDLEKASDEDPRRLLQR
ncbi:hypothetical protein D9619_011186 [Psilocybe cf. subviscida]|uniref:Uncharacterized protein n=1 Tax=Psilocybe cf. subviscida TaxID=2480587 RepID=A0A8H5BLN1_9AGAR|nr:hypothetical protein D9619_011186 [Psilocybe cf. subviscida]